MHSGMFRWMEHDRMNSVRGRQMFSQYFEWQKRVSTCHILWVLLLLFGERKKFHFFPFFKGNVKRQLVKRELCRRPSDDDDCICVSNFVHQSCYLAPEYFQPRNVTHLLRDSINNVQRTILAHFSFEPLPHSESINGEQTNKDVIGFPWDIAWVLRNFFLFKPGTLLSNFMYWNFSYIFRKLFCSFFGLSLYSWFRIMSLKMAKVNADGFFFISRVPGFIINNKRTAVYTRTPYLMAILCDYIHI